MKPAKKWLLVGVWLFTLLLIVKVVLLLMAEPQVTVDYVAEYNRLCRPQNYDPDDDAAPYYRKAFDTFIYMPVELGDKPYVNWPTDFSEAEQALLERWLVSNSQTFVSFRAAAEKPYCWLERRTGEKDSMFGIMLPELLSFGALTKAMVWEAKLKAMNGEYRSAFGDIADCYRATRHKCCGRLFLTTQHAGLSVRKSVISGAFVILDRSGAGSSDLEFFQDVMQAEIDSDAYMPDIQAERFFVYDALQQTFVDNGRGTGRLAWSVGGYCLSPSFKQRVKECFLGPTRNQIVEQTEEVLAITNQMMGKTPWQVESGKYGYLEEIKGINNSNSFLRNFGLKPYVTFHLYYKMVAQEEALVTVIAVLRYKEDTGQLPETLDKLVAAGYLRSVPMDPYSDGALVYKVTGDDFELYSIGGNFSDDGGAIEAVTRPLRRLRPVGTDVEPSDIIFWPVMY